MKILMLVNWPINYLSKNNRIDGQSPGKVVSGEKYWFFRHWPDDKVRVDVMDFTKLPLFHYLEKRILKFYIWQSIRALFKAKQYDLIISHGAQSGLLLAFLRGLIRGNMPPHIIIDVGCFNGARDNKWEIAPIKFAAKSLAGVVYHATVQKEYYQKHLPFLKTRFVPFGVDTDSFCSMEMENKDYVVSIGYTKRDYKTLLEAWQKIPAGKTKLKIIGVNNLRAWGIENIPPNVETLGWLHVNKLKETIAKARFVILPLPYYKYAYGQMSLLQSMAMAKAVIVTKTPSTVDYITDGRDALLVEPYSIDDMKQKIEFLLANPATAKTIGQKARETVLQEFNEKIMARNIYKFINETI